MSNREFEIFNALIRDSRLNANPALAPRQYRVGELAMEFVRCKEYARQSKIAAEMFLIEVHEALALEKAREEAAAKTVTDTPTERPPMLELVHQLIDASVERSRLKLPPPVSIERMSKQPTTTGPIGAMAEDTLRRSLAESREMCDDAKEAAAR